MSSTGRKELFNSQKHLNICTMGVPILPLRRRHLSVPNLTVLFLLALLIDSPSSSPESTANCFYPRCSVVNNYSSKQNNGSISSIFAPNDILLCGDIKSQPGPATTTNASSTPTAIPPHQRLSSTSSVSSSNGRRRKTANPCTACAKGVTKASKAVSCDDCDRWTHVRCAPLISLELYNACVSSGDEIQFSCDACSWKRLPFHDVDGEEEVENGADPAAAPTPGNVSLPSLPDILLRKGLHILHANTHSLLPKLPEVRLLLTRIRASIFAATETWLDSSIGDGELEVPGFNILRRDRNRTGGGVALFIRSDIAFNPRPDLSADNLEALWIEVLLPKTRGILVGVFYRPPSDREFLSKLELSLSKTDPGKEISFLAI